MRIHFQPCGPGTLTWARRFPRSNAPSPSLRSSRPTQAPYLQLRLKPGQFQDSPHRSNPAQLQDFPHQQASHEPVPGQSHPIHVSALQAELGHHIYSTGMFSPGLGHAGVSNATLKLFSHGPIEGSSYTLQHHDGFCELFQANTQLLDGSVWSAYYYLYLIARKALLSQEHSRDVHAQIHSLPGEQLRSLEFRPGKRLVNSARTWNLFCRLGKSSEGRNMLSRPYLTFQLSAGRISDWCGVTSSGKGPPQMLLSLTLAGSLKANPYRDPGPHHPPGQIRGSALQHAADELATQSICAVIDQGAFLSTGAVMSAVRHNLLSYLPSSPIAAALDLNHLGINLQIGFARARLVQNILLNNDGTVKNDINLPMSLPALESDSAIDTPQVNRKDLSALEDSPKDEAPSREATIEPEQNASITKMSTVNMAWMFSDSTQRKLGTDLTWEIEDHTALGLTAEQQLPALREFDRHCQVSGGEGFTLLVNVVSHMSQVSPSAAAFDLRGQLGNVASSASEKTDMVPGSSNALQRAIDALLVRTRKFAIRINHEPDPDLTTISLYIPGLLGVKYKIGTGVQELHISVHLIARVNHKNGVSQSSNSSSTISDEIDYLWRAAGSIVAHVSQATTFDSVQACVRTINEAILRFLRFRSANVQPYQVRVHAIGESVNGQAFIIKSVASFRHRLRMSASGDSATRRVDVSTKGPFTEGVATDDTVETEQRLKSNANSTVLDDQADGVTDQLDPQASASAEDDVAIPRVAKDNQKDHANEEATHDEDTKQQSISDAVHPIEVNEAEDSISRKAPKGKYEKSAAGVLTRVDPETMANSIYIALGSNIGDRIEAIENACRILDADIDIHVAETSALYETDPMYVEDQGRFLNGVCKILTSLEPIELLDRLQAVENGLGRHKTIDKGPRNIDLDILTYGQRLITTERLTVPHALMLEREFVLRPLCDTSGSLWRHPTTNAAASAHLRRLPASGTPMYPITSLGVGLEPLRSLDPRRRTQVMSILNVTPDSFSDGGVNQPTDMSALKDTILANIAAGATIIDIGGQSSRPNAEDVRAEEEISRILPAIHLIKSLPEAQGIAISIDTYRAKVAEAAINAGAHIVNDISAGLLDPDMLSTVARLGCTYIMMHMRGTPGTMQNDENTSYPDGVLPTVARELQSRLDAAQNAGIRKWRIILDPGIGFAKTLEQNVELLKRFRELRKWKGLHTYPWLVGTSRKGFIGKITGVTHAKDRVGGTAATVTAAVQGGAEIVRVHDVKTMADVVKMADAMYRRS